MMKVTLFLLFIYLLFSFGQVSFYMNFFFPAGAFGLANCEGRAAIFGAASSLVLHREEDGPFINASS